MNTQIKTFGNDHGSLAHKVLQDFHETASPRSREKREKQHVRPTGNDPSGPESRAKPANRPRPDSPATHRPTNLA